MGRGPPHIHLSETPKRVHNRAVISPQYFAFSLFFAIKLTCSHEDMLLQWSVQVACYKSNQLSIIQRFSIIIVSGSQ